MKSIAVCLVLLLLQAFCASAGQDVEAVLTQVDYQLRHGERVRVRVDAMGALERVEIREEGWDTEVSPADFGKIEHVVLNAVKIYADARLKEDGTFDRYIYLRIAYRGARNSQCYLQQNSAFPHDCDVVTLFFTNGELSSVDHKRADQEH